MRLTRRGKVALVIVIYGAAFLFGILTANWNWPTNSTGCVVTTVGADVYASAPCTDAEAEGE